MSKREEATIIRDTIRSNLPDGVNVELKNFYNCVEVSGAYDIYIWIRLLNYGSGYIVDFSSVFMGELMRKGILTKLFNAVKSIDFVKEVRVTSVTTVMMQSWCVKNKFSELGICDYSYDCNN